MDYMGATQRLKRILSIFLSLAMAVTLLPSQMAYAQTDNSETEISTLSDEMGLPEELAHFSFDSEDEIAGKVVGDETKVELVSMDDGSGRQALHLTEKVNGKGAFISALDGSVLAGKDALTISYWSKIDTGEVGGWTFYAAENNMGMADEDSYIGFMDKEDNIQLERYYRTRGANNSKTATKSGLTKNEWRHVTVVFQEEYSTVYVNGEAVINIDPLQPSLSKILTKNSLLKIGSCNWNRKGAVNSVVPTVDAAGEPYQGYLDDFIVYDGALDAAQVKYLYDGTTNKDDAAETPSGCRVDNAHTMRVGESREVSDWVTRTSGAVVLGSHLTYQVADTSVLADDGAGRVKALKAGATNVTMNVKYGAKTYQRTIEVTVKAFETETGNSFDFNSASEGKLTLDSGMEAVVKKASGHGQDEYTGDIAAGTGRSGQDGDYALKLSTAAKYGVKIPKELGKDYTVSLWVKLDKTILENQPIVFVGNPDPEKWLSIGGDKGDNNVCKVWTNEADNDAYNWKTVANITVPAAWTMLTLSQTGERLSIYQNGELVQSGYAAQAMDNEDEDAYIQLGVGYWQNDHAINGLIDDVNLYDSALDAAQVKVLYASTLSAEQAADWLEIKGENTNLNCVTKDLNLPEEKDGITITWAAKEGENASTAVTAAGKVTAGGGNKVTLTAACSDAQTGMNWTTEIPVKVARKVIIRCLDEEAAGTDNADLIKTVERMEEEDSEYVHTPEEIVITEDGAYKYEATGTKNTQGLKITVGADSNTVNVAYKQVAIKSVVTPDDAYAIEGNDPILPQRLKATAEADGQEITVNAPVDWEDDYTGLKAKKEPYIINGKVGDKEISVKVTVFECDAEMPEVASTYTNNDNTRFLSLKGKYKGVIETEFDIVNARPSSKQGVFFLLDDQAPGAWWNNAAALEFDTSSGCYQAIGGNGKGGNATNSNAENSKYPANKGAENAVLYDGTGTYHVRIRIDTTDVDSTVAEGAAAVNKNATFQIWITDKNGKTTELTKGVTATSRHIISGIISKYFVGTNIEAENGDFKVTNHKLSWQSGYVTKKIETFVDDIRIADLSSSSKLLPSSLMTAEEQKAYSYEPAPNITQGEDKCVLQTEESGWFDEEDNKIADDAVAGKAVADAVLTYKVYYKKGVADFAGLGAKIKEAQKIYDEQALIYTAASLKYLDDAIKAAQTVAENDESSVDDVEDAITALDAALNKTDVTLVPKDYEAMNEALTAYYPMTEESRAGDTVGEYDGTVNGSVTFSNDGGARLPGSSSKLTNYISLPDTLPISDKMTFSFWVYCDNNADTETNASHKMHNTFCIGSGKKVGSNAGTTTGHHVSIYAGQEGEYLTVNGGPDAWGDGLDGVTVDGYEKQKWSLVTCVIDGKNATVYQDGVKKDSNTIGVTLTEAWNANAEERYILLGNNCYAYNGDWDYKGNIKNFRIYNAPLVDQQVKDIFDNEVQELLDASAEKLASTMKAQPGTGEMAGKYTLEITANKIKLPNQGSQKETISWKAYSADGETESTAVINPETGAVTVPEAGAAGVTAVLKATITISGVEKEAVIICDVKNPINKESTAALKNEAAAAMEGKNKADYEASVWDELEAAIKAYEELPEDAAPDKIAEAYNRMKAALDAFVPKTTTTVEVTDVTLDKTTLTLTEGQSETLKATVNPAEADQAVTWESSKPDVASVVDGKVTAKKAGTTVITVTSTADTSKKATCTVTVKAKTVTVNPVAVKNVTLNVKKLTMGVKESYTLKATVNPGNASNRKVTWKSDKPKIVSVKNGKITAKKTGKAKITVTSSANSKKKATVTVTVKKAPDKKAKVTLNKKTVKLKVKKTFQIKAKVSSKYGSATFKYTIDKKGKKAVKVDKDGKVTAKKKGTATITVKPYNGKGKSAKVKITVK